MENEAGLFLGPEATLTIPGFLRAEWVPQRPGRSIAYVVYGAHPAQPA